LEYICSCDGLWQKGLYVELYAYQYQVFIDWRFVDDEKWRDIYVALNGAGVESMSAKWDEMFGVKEETVEKEVKVKKPRKKAVEKRTASKKTATKRTSGNKKNSAKKVVKETKKAPVKKKPTAEKAVVKKSPTKGTKSKLKAGIKMTKKTSAKK